MRFHLVVAVIGAGSDLQWSLATPDAWPHTDPQRWQQFRPRFRWLQLRQDRLERIEPRCQRERVVVDRVVQAAHERGRLVVGEVEVRIPARGYRSPPFAANRVPMMGRMQGWWHLLIITMLI